MNFNHILQLPIWIESRKCWLINDSFFKNIFQQQELLPIQYFLSWKQQLPQFKKKKELGKEQHNREFKWTLCILWGAALIMSKEQRVYVKLGLAWNHGQSLTSHDWEILIYLCFYFFTYKYGLFYLISELLQGNSRKESSIFLAGPPLLTPRPASTATVVMSHGGNLPNGMDAHRTQENISIQKNSEITPQTWGQWNDISHKFLPQLQL